MLQTLFSFHGRMRRSYYWAVGLIMTLGVLPLAMGLITPLLPHDESSEVPLTPANEVGYALLAVFFFVYAWVRLAIQVKRWHDRGKSGWWTLIILIPFLGGLWMFIECGFLDGDPGRNKYGPSPKDPNAKSQPAVLEG